MTLHFYEIRDMTISQPSFKKREKKRQRSHLFKMKLMKY